jgi:hypothetical protein
MKPLRPWREVLNAWSPELATKLRRPVSEILAKGLSASDFSPSSSVEVRYPFGATHRFTFASAVVRPERGEAAVFSEHAGYIEFDLVDECVVAEIHEDVIHRHEA